MTLINNCYRNRYNIKNTNSKVWSTAFIEISEYLQGLIDILMDTNSNISTTDPKNVVSALITTITLTTKQVAKMCNPV